MDRKRQKTQDFKQNYLDSLQKLKETNKNDEKIRELLDNHRKAKEEYAKWYHGSNYENLVYKNTTDTLENDLECAIATDELYAFIEK